MWCICVCVGEFRWQMPMAGWPYNIMDDFESFFSFGLLIMYLSPFGHQDYDFSLVANEFVSLLSDFLSPDLTPSALNRTLFRLKPNLRFDIVRRLSTV